MSAGTVILVEGYFDCLRVHQAGFSWVVALMGSSLSAAQETALLGHFDRVTVMLVEMRPVAPPVRPLHPGCRAAVWRR